MSFLQYTYSKQFCQSVTLENIPNIRKLQNQEMVKFGLTFLSSKDACKMHQGFSQKTDYDPNT